MFFVGLILGPLWADEQDFPLLAHTTSGGVKGGVGGGVSEGNTIESVMF
jgi:hypothetical protein